MVTFKLHVNPLTKEVSFDIEGSYDEIRKVDLNKINELNKVVEEIIFVLQNNKSKLLPSKAHNMDKKNTADETQLHLEIKVPGEIIDDILNLKERVRFPILWYFSNQSIMKVKEFLTACADKGFPLRTTWLPNLGGDFTKILVHKDKMFHEVDKVDGEKRWTLTDVGKLKIKKLINELESNRTNKNT